MAPKFAHALATGAALLLVALLEAPAGACPPRNTGPVASVRAGGGGGRADYLELRLKPGAEPGVLTVSSGRGPARHALIHRGSAVARVPLTPTEQRDLEAGEPILFSVDPEIPERLTRPDYFVVVPDAQTRKGLRPDHLLFVFLGLSLLGVGWLYRREPAPEHRLRLAGAAGLIAVLFLCTAPAMPWTETRTDDGLTRAQCMLGQEAPCVTRGGDAGAAGAELLEQAHITSAAIRAGHAVIILMLLPACIWLMVAPRSRGAQALTVAGAAPALFTALATTFYSWLLSGSRTGAGGAADLTLLACASLVAVAAVAGLLGRRLRAGEPLPAAVARDCY